MIAWCRLHFDSLAKTEDTVTWRGVHVTFFCFLFCCLVVKLACLTVKPVLFVHVFGVWLICSPTSDGEGEA